jgi:hypothetical protein
VDLVSSLFKRRGGFRRPSEELQIESDFLVDGVFSTMVDLDLLGKSGGTFDNVASSGGLYDPTSTTKIYG